jgi:hypothetical protein
MEKTAARLGGGAMINDSRQMNHMGSAPQIAGNRLRL